MSKSSQLLHLDPLAIALEKRRKSEQEKENPAPNPDPETPEKSSQPILSSQPTLSWQPKEPPRGGPKSWQLNMGSQPNMSSQSSTDNQTDTKSVNLLSSLPEVKGDIRMPHRYSDHLCKLLKPVEQAVYWQLYRLSWGWGKESCFISNPKLSERSNVSLSSMKRAIAGLVAKNLIEKTGQTNGYGKEQGVEYRVFNMGWQPNMSSQPTLSCQPTVDPIKDIYINTHTQREKSSRKQKKEKDSNEEELASRGVGVESKFSLEECKRYAEHLQATGQGINNPGGFAMMIYRSGRADPLIADFLNPSDKSPSPDTSGCGLCHGSGFYYPSDPAQGVVKCKHEGLDANEISVTQAKRRLTAEEVAEQASVIGELLKSGYTVKQAEEQFGASLDPDDWREILARTKQDG